MDEIQKALQDYVATANSGKYGDDWDTLNSKFPELSNYDNQALKDYVATANSGKYGDDWDTLNSKFPEFFGDQQEATEPKGAKAEQSGESASASASMVDSSLDSKQGVASTEPPKDKLTPLAESIDPELYKEYQDLKRVVDSKSVMETGKEYDRMKEIEKTLNKAPSPKESLTSILNQQKEGLNKRQDEVIKKLDEVSRSTGEPISDLMVRSGSYQDILNQKKNIDKALQIEKEDAEYGFWDDSYKKIKANTATAIGNLAAVPSYMDQTMFTIIAPKEQIDFANSLDFKTREKYITKVMSKMSPLGEYRLDMMELSERVQADMKQQAEKISSEMYQWETDIYADIENDNFGQAGTRIVSEAIGSLPSLAQAMIPYVGIGSIVAGSAAAKQDELQEEGYDLGLATSTNSAINGAAEGLLELFTKKLGTTLFKSLNKAGEQGSKTMLKSIYDNLLKAPFLEGGSEAATSIIQNLSDKLVQGKEVEFQDAWKETVEAFLIGFATGGGLGTSTYAAEATQRLYEDSERQKIIKSESNDFNSIKDAFNPDSPKVFSTDQLKMANMPSTQNALSSELKKEVKAGRMTPDQKNAVEHRLAEINKALKSTQKVNMSDENRTKAVNLVVEKQKLQADIKEMDDAIATPVKERIKEIDNQLVALATGKPVENAETETPAKETTKPAVEETTPAVKEEPTKRKETVSEVINRPVTLTELGGSKLDTPIKGDMYVEGQRVVVEDANGNITDIGNVDEVSGQSITDLGIEYEASNVEVTKEGGLIVEGTNYAIQSDLPTRGIEYNKDGTIKSVSVKDETGKPTQFDGAVAEDVGYQILLNEATSPEQAERVNEILEQDEEFQNKLREAEAAAETGAGQGTTADGKQDAAKTFAKELEETKKAEPEDYWSVDKVSEEDAREGTVIDTGDGYGVVGKDGDIKGVFKKISSKSRGVAAKILKKAVEAGGTKLDNFDGYLSKIYKKAGFRVVSSTPFNEEYAPEGWNKEKHGTPRVVAMIYDPNNEFNFEEKSFPDTETGYDQMIAYRDEVLNKGKDGTKEGTAKADDTTAAKEDTGGKTAGKDKGNAGDVQTDGKKVGDSDKLMKLLNKAQGALRKFAPEVKFNAYDNTEAYNKAIGKKEGDPQTAGEWDPVNNTITINLELANERTIAHETVHAILGKALKTDAALQKISDKFLEVLAKNVDADVRQELNDFVEVYDQGVRSEEAVTELTAMLAANYTKLSNKAQNIIKQWLDKVAKRLGLKQFTDNEVIDLLNTLSSKIASGVAITDADIKPLNDGITERKNEERSKKFQANYKDKTFGYEFVYDKNSDRFKNLEKNGFINRDVDIKTFNGEKVLLHQPDGAFSGMIFRNGELLVEGKGGVFYPIKFHEDGYFWASTASAADKMAKDLNKLLVDNEGTIYMALTSAPVDKLLSSTTMSNATLDFFVSKSLDRKIKLGKGVVERAVIEAANTVVIKTVKGKDKKEGLDLNLKKGDNFSDNLSIIKKKLNPDNSAFPDRKTFSQALIKIMVNEINKSPKAVEQFGEFFNNAGNKYYKGVTKTGKYKISFANVKQALSDMFSEPLTKDFQSNKKGGYVYAVLEINGQLEQVDSNKHESYPKALRGIDAKTKVHILKDAPHWTTITKDPETNDFVKPDRENNLYPPSTGVSTTGVELDTGRVESSRTKKGQITPQQAKAKSEASSKAARKQASGENKGIRERVGNFVSGLVDTYVDRQGSVKKAFNKVGMDKVVDYMVTKSGYSSYAKNRSREVYNSVFKGLSNKDIETLEEIILHRRIMAVDENRDLRGLEPVKHQDGFNYDLSEAALEGYRQDMGDKKFNELSERADAYFNEYKSLLGDMRDEGLISEDTYELFAEIDYQPRIFLDFLEDMDGNLLMDEIDSSEKVPLSEKQIKAMKGGSEGNQLMDAWYLIQKSIQSRTAAIFSNRLNKTFAEEFAKTKAEVEALKGKTILTSAEKKKIKDFNKVLDNVKEDKIIGYTDSGNPKYEMDGKNTKGLKSLYYYEDGLKNRIWMKEDFFNKFTDTKNAYLTGDVREAVALATGTSSVKTLATGNNPLFFITNTPRDLAFVLTFSKEYGNNVLTNSVKLIKDSVKGVADVVNNSENYKKFLEYGGGMDYLAIQGKYKSKGFTRAVVDNVMDTRTQDKIVRNSVKRFLDKFNLASEMGIRLAVFNKSVANQTKGKDMSTMSKEEVDHIYTKAVRSARELTDFNQGGKVTKALDAGIPYLNAATQGTRAAVNNLADRPVETMWRITQMTGYAVASTVGAALGAISYFRDEEDEDTKGMTNAQIYFETLDTVSEYDLTNYFIMPLGVKDERGNWKYLRVAKAQALTPMINASEHYVRKAMASNGDIDYRQDLGKTMSNTITSNILPISVNPFDNITRIPVVDAAFAWNGIDSYTGNPLDWDRGDIPAGTEGIVNKDVEPLFKQIGEMTDLSPIRLQEATESFLTTPSTNPYVGVIYAMGNLTATNRTTADVADDFGKDMLESASKRLMKSGSEYNKVSKMKERVSEEAFEAFKKHIIIEDGVRTLVKDYKEDRDLDKTISDARKLAEDNPEMTLRIVSWIKSEAKKQKMEPLVASLKFEQNKEVKAMLIVEKFGDMLLKENRKNLTKKDIEIIAKLARNKIFDKETMMHYQMIINNK